MEKKPLELDNSRDGDTLIQPLKASRKTKWVMALVTAAATLTGIACWNSPSPAEPVYQGKTFSQWYAEIPVLPRSLTLTSDPALDAIKAMGKAAVPFAISRIRSVNSPFHNWFAPRLNSLPPVQKFFEIDPFNRAVECLSVLDTNVEPNLPELIEIARKTGPDRREWAMHILERNPTHPNLAIPFLFEAVTNSNVNLRIQATSVLQQYKWDAIPALKAAIPLMTSRLANEPNLIVRSLILQLIGQLGRDGKSAVPAMVKVWHTETDPRIKSRIEKTAWLIDQEAALPIFMSRYQTETWPEREVILGIFDQLGPGARAVVPMLVAEWGCSTNTAHRECIAYSIRQIDPETAAKMGMKWIP